jgi:hypothetical protein
MFRISLVCLCCCLLISCLQELRAQEQWGAQAHYGFIIPHSRELIDVSRSHPRGASIQMNWLLDSEKHQRESGLIARRGFAAYFMDFDNPAVLGWSAAVVPYVEPLIRPHKRLHAGVQLGLGVAYVSKVYHPERNPTNIFFSLPVSLWAMLNARVYYQYRPNWQLMLGMNHNHISNGGMKNPNKGMNFPTWNLGLAYQMQAMPVRRLPKSQDWRQAPRSAWHLALAGSVKNLNPSPEFPQTVPTLLYGLQGMYAYRIGRMSHLSGGAECLYDGYEAELLQRQGLQRSAWKVALLLGHEWQVGRVRFTVHLAPYLFNSGRKTAPDPLNDRLYQRYGLYYRVGKHWYLGGSLKTHRHVADVADARLGWIF